LSIILILDAVVHPIGAVFHSSPEGSRHSPRGRRKAGRDATPSTRALALGEAKANVMSLRASTLAERQWHPGLTASRFALQSHRCLALPIRVADIACPAVAWPPVAFLPLPTLLSTSVPCFCESSRCCRCTGGVKSARGNPGFPNGTSGCPFVSACTSAARPDAATNVEGRRPTLFSHLLVRVLVNVA
jgi:hypothetical protein